MNIIDINKKDIVECYFYITQYNVPLFQIKNENLDHVIMVKVNDNGNIELYSNEKTKVLRNFSSFIRYDHNIKFKFNEALSIEIDNLYKYDLKSIKLNYNDLKFYTTVNDNVILSGLNKNE